MAREMLVQLYNEVIYDDGVLFHKFLLPIENIRNLPHIREYPTPL